MSGSSSSPVLYQAIALASTPDSFYLRPTDCPGDVTPVLAIDRVAHRITVQGDSQIVYACENLQSICGVVGIIDLLSGPYLVVITRRTLVGRLRGHEIWQMAETAVLPFSTTRRHLSNVQEKDEQSYLLMLQGLLAMPGFYFSYTLDITHTMQHLETAVPETHRKPLYEQVDPQFYWNSFLQRAFQGRPELAGFALPIMCGFISITTGIVLRDSRFDFILISRRSTHRAGTRFNRRGIDTSGKVANFVETEQIVDCVGCLGSVVQIRGSIPLFWSQSANIRLKPRVRIDAEADHTVACSTHIHTLITRYGNLLSIDLIDQRGMEKPLGDCFKQTLLKVGQQARYLPFDFHKECAGMRWDRITLLMEQVSSVIDEFSFFLMDGNNRIHRKQEGVFRTNCLDCLDRTNVVQSMIARKCLEDQFQYLGVLSARDSLTAFASFNSLFNNVWADNADMLSLQYSGSKALKADFTRTGKRTVKGAMEDLWNTALRFFKNNATDGFRQDSFDVFLGKYMINTQEGAGLPSPLAAVTPTYIRLLPVLAFICLAMCVLSLLFQSADSTSSLGNPWLWLLATVASSLVVLRLGSQIVDSPKLCRETRERMTP